MTLLTDSGEDHAIFRSATQKALGDIAPHHDLCHRPELVGDVARRHWAVARELGWTGLAVDPDHGGSGLGLDYLAILAEEMGAALFCGPFLANSVLAVTLAGLGRGQDVFADLLRRIAHNEITLAAAVLPDSCRWLASAPDLVFADAATTTVRGRRELVEHCSLATHFLALDAWNRDGRVELRAAVVELSDQIRTEARTPFDVGCPVSAVEFADAAVEPGNLLVASLALPEFEELMTPVHLAIAAELLGVAQAALDRTIDHVKTRTQFGAAIGSFQAVKHAIADVSVATESARLAVRNAAATSLASDVHVARIVAADAARKATAAYVQFLGALGFSWESDAHLYLKRMRRLMPAFGDMDSFRAAVAHAFIDATLGRDANPTVK